MRTSEFVSFIKHYQGDQIMDDELREACSTQGRDYKSYIVLIGKPEGSKSHGRPQRRWEDNVTMVLYENRVGSYGLDSCSSEKDQWRTVVNTVLKFWVL